MLLHRHSPLKSLRFIGLLCALVICAYVSVAQDELTETTFTEDGLTVSVTHPTNWFSASDDEALYLSNTESALEVLATGEGSLERGIVGYIVYAPSLVDTLDLPEGADNVAALEALIALRGLPEYSSGEVYSGDPALVFFQKPAFDGASTDLYGYEFDETIIFVAMVNTDVDYEITQAVLDSVALTTGEVDEAASEEPRELVVTVTDVEDEAITYDFTATLPVGWVEFYDEETGTLILASSTAALDIASAAALEAIATAEGETSDPDAEAAYERSDSVIVIVLPTVLKGLEVDTTESVDMVLTAFAATLGIEAFPSLTEREGITVADAPVISENIIGGSANLYAYAFPDGVVITIVHPNDGSGNPETSDVLRSIGYGVTVAAEQ